MDGMESTDGTEMATQSRVTSARFPAGTGPRDAERERHLNDLIVRLNNGYWKRPPAGLFAEEPGVEAPTVQEADHDDGVVVPLIEHEVEAPVVPDPPRTLSFVERAEIDPAGPERAPVRIAPARPVTVDQPSRDDRTVVVAVVAIVAVAWLILRRPNSGRG